jgi:hypothetical protein
VARSPSRIVGDCDALFQPVVNPNSVALAAQATTATLTTTTVNSNLPGGATLGQPVTFTATVQAGAGTPTGTVRFQIGRH